MVIFPVCVLIFRHLKDARIRHRPFSSVKPILRTINQDPYFAKLTGGEVHHGKVSDSCEKYDPIKDKWVEVEPIPRPRADHAACANGGNLYVSGGISNLKHQCSNVFW